MARPAYLLFAAACTRAAVLEPCPAGVSDDLNWYTTTSSGKVHDCAWLRADPDNRCNNDGRFINCPASCGGCRGVCQNGEADDATWRRKHEAADGPHGCAWAAQEPRNRCFEMGTDNRRSGEACEAACGFCVGAPTWPHSEGPDGPLMDDVDPFPENAGTDEDYGDLPRNADDDDKFVEVCGDDPSYHVDGGVAKEDTMGDNPRVYGLRGVELKEVNGGSNDSVIKRTLISAVDIFGDHREEILVQMADGSLRAYLNVEPLPMTKPTKLEDAHHRKFLAHASFPSHVRSASSNNGE